MELNVTLFIQMINFFIAWFLLRTLYFKPAIAFLDQQQAKHDQMVGVLQRWQSDIAVQEHEIEQVWDELKLFSTEHSPESLDPHDAIFKDIVPIPEQSSIDTKQIDRLTKEIKQMVIAEVAHVDL